MKVSLREEFETAAIELVKKIRGAKLSVEQKRLDQWFEYSEDDCIREVKRELEMAFDRGGLDSEETIEAAFADGFREGARKERGVA